MLASAGMPRTSIILLTGLAFASCADGDGCRSQSECAPAQSCVPPGVPRRCGIPCVEERLCESAADCEAGQVCEEYVGGCCFAGELSSRCVPPCAAGSCAAGERCDASSGLCLLIACDEGFACGPHTSCAPSTAGADVHGCVRDACVGDADCEGGACVEGLCYEGAGTCEPAIP